MWYNLSCYYFPYVEASLQRLYLSQYLQRFGLYAADLDLEHDNSVCFPPQNQVCSA